MSVPLAMRTDSADGYKAREACVAAAVGLAWSVLSACALLATVYVTSVRPFVCLLSKATAESSLTPVERCNARQRMVAALGQGQVPKAEYCQYVVLLQPMLSKLWNLQKQAVSALVSLQCAHPRTPPLSEWCYSRILSAGRHWPARSRRHRSAVPFVVLRRRRRRVAHRRPVQYSSSAALI